MGQKVSPSSANVAAGVDVGGTYTDLVLIDRQTGKVRLAKTPTTPENQAFGVIKALEIAETPLSEIDLIVHGKCRSQMESIFGALRLKFYCPFYVNQRRFHIAICFSLSVLNHSVPGAELPISLDSERQLTFQIK